MQDPFVFPLRIYVEDTDFGGVVYHTNYLKFMERARTEWLCSVGLDISAIAKSGLLFIVKDINIEYLRPAFLNNRINIISRIEKLGRTSIIFNQNAQANDDPNLIYCQANVTIVCVNDSLKPIPMPSSITEIFA